MTPKKPTSASKAAPTEPAIEKIEPATKGKALARAKAPAKAKAKTKAPRKAAKSDEEIEELEDEPIEPKRSGKKGRSLVIVESPAKARTIGKYLGPNFEVRASNGHVRDLPKSKLGVDIEKGFQPSYILIKGKAKILKELKASARQASTIYLAPDPDREGEAIAWHLAETLGNGSDGRIQRLAFYEITKRGVLSALETPRTIDMNKVHAQQARRVLDRLVGYQVSPFLWKTVRYGLSAGRVQSVALRLICEREDEVRAFVPREYWTLDADLATAKDERFRARVQKRNGEKIALTNEAQATEAAAELAKQSFRVTGVRTQEKKRNPLPPFITSTLQQESFQRLRFSAQKTMVVAQQLYEGIDIGAEGSTGLITYMRTDSTRTSPEALAEVREFVQASFGAEYLPPEARIFRSRETSQ
ncbi:MAG TPA: type I DNA topoisomerase, partial [Candidatus Saccharimonadales bacterium]|nr:type I DNA topoisomerase [Candidatus Saccharimonadales bacterium]